MSLVINEDASSGKWFVEKDEFNGENSFEISKEIAEDIMKYQSFGKIIFWMINNIPINFNTEDEAKKEEHSKKVKEFTEMIRFYIKQNKGGKGDDVSAKRDWDAFNEERRIEKATEKEKEDE